ncbi:hypothetical protein ScPMuIL_006490 [Solemya velum]
MVDREPSLPQTIALKNGPVYLLLLLVHGGLGRHVIKRDLPDPDDTPYMLNGEEVDIRDKPFMCYLEKEGQFLCSCVLIDKRHVLTTVVCTTTGATEDYTVVFGVQNPQSLQSKLEKGTALRVGVSSLHRHPEYRIEDSTPFNNLAVYELEYDISSWAYYSSRARPLDRLATPGESFVNNTNCYVIGYGMVSIEELQKKVFLWNSLEGLQEANVPVISHAECGHRMVAIADNTVCVLDEKSYAIACFGGRGGLLVCEIDTLWTLVGFTRRAPHGCKAISFFEEIAENSHWVEEQIISRWQAMLMHWNLWPKS